MTNKPTWEEELMQVREQTHYPHLKTTRCFVVEDLKQFISTKLAEQRREIIEKIKKQEMPQYQDDGAEHAHAGYVKALEEVIELIKQN